MQNVKYRNCKAGHRCNRLGLRTLAGSAHCDSNLRVMVGRIKISKDVVENIEKVQGAFFNSGQYQIIFGTGTVNKIYDE